MAYSQMECSVILKNCGSKRLGYSSDYSAYMDSMGPWVPSLALEERLRLKQVQ